MEQLLHPRVEHPPLLFCFVLSLFLCNVVCVERSIAVEKSYMTNLWKPFRIATDAHDDILNYTFHANEFGAPWGDAAATNADAAISFGIFHAQGPSLTQTSRENFEPWKAKQLNKSFCFKSGLNGILADVRKKANVKVVAVFVHGFLDNGRGLPRITDNVTYGSWPAIAAASFSILSPHEYLGVVVDWEAGASGFSRYPRAMSTTRVVGLYLAQVLVAAKHVFGSKVQTWCVGHSLGAHACGLAGKYSVRQTKLRWDVISGLDPAGPSVTFLRSIGTSWVDPAFQNARLSPSDATYTEVLHTDWGGLGFHTLLAACIDQYHWYASWKFQDCLRSRLRLGHVEVFANPLNYTAAGSIYPSWLPDQAFLQPGCNHFHLFCSHHYAKNLMLFRLSRRLGDSAFVVNSTCGSIQKDHDPLNVCPLGHIAAGIQILTGLGTEYDHADMAYSFDGLRVPSLEELSKRYPDETHLAEPLSLGETYGHEDIFI